MEFWDNALRFFWGKESFPLLVMVLAVFVLLYHFRAEDRPGLQNTLGFYFACLLGQFISGIAHAMELIRPADIMNEVFDIGAGIAVIRLLGLLVFRIVLPRSSSRRPASPRISSSSSPISPGSWCGCAMRASIWAACWRPRP